MEEEGGRLLGRAGAYVQREHTAVLGQHKRGMGVTKQTQVRRREGKASAKDRFRLRRKKRKERCTRRGKKTNNATSRELTENSCTPQVH